jgi:DNA-binding NtrC family response regulator
MSTKLKILLAEDEPSLCRYIETLLDQWECDIVVEQTAELRFVGPLGLSPMLRSSAFITPGMDGAKAGIELLRVSPGTKVVLTVESVPSEVLGDLRMQGYDFRTLVVPFNIEELQSLCFPPIASRRGISELFKGRGR